MTVRCATWGLGNSHSGRRQEGFSKMMALSVFLHLSFFAFLILNNILWKMRQPAFQGFQVNLVSSRSGSGGPGGPGPGRSRSFSRTAISGQSKVGSSAKSGGSKKAMPSLNLSTKNKKGSIKVASVKKTSASSKRISTTKPTTKPLSVQSPVNRVQKVNEGVPPPLKDDPERLEEWWKKQTQALKIPATTLRGKVNRPPSRRRRTAKIDIDRKSIVLPSVAFSDPSLPKSVTPPAQLQSGPPASSGNPNGTGQDHSKTFERLGTNPGDADLQNLGNALEDPSFSGGDVTGSVGSEGSGSGLGLGGMASIGSTGGIGIVGTGGARTGGGGSGLSSFRFPGYLDKIDNKIRWQWAPPPVKSKENDLLLRFSIGRNGSIDKRSVVIERSSGNPFFDQAAMRAVLAAHPFPPLPKAYSEDRLTVYMNFIVKEDS